LETLRCPACFFMLTDPGASRCPSCNKKLRRRGRPIVLGDEKHFGTQAPTDIDLLLAERAERAERAQALSPDDPLVASVPAAPPVANEPDAMQHTTIFEPSQLDPEMRQVLDSLYRKARSEADDDTP
jgi:hypothetical protein